MATLLCFGLGYSAEHYVAACGARYDRVVGTVRTVEKANARPSRPAFEVMTFDGLHPSEPLVAAIGGADALLVSIPPRDTADPVLEVLGGALARAPQLQAIVYLSTVGVYGDRGGECVDETADPRPRSARSHARLAAENAWLNLGRRTGKSVAVLRLAGIYGPGRNALVNLAHGSARRIVKPGQVFNRIHVTDIAQAIDAAIDRRAAGVFNVADDEPGPPQDVVTFAAKLLGCEPPPELSFAQAQRTMTAIARSFYGDNKRVCNARLKTELGVRLKYPTYRDGLRALHEAGDGRSD